MPIYHYACQCGRAEDGYRSIADRDNAPECCSGPMRRVICAPSMVMPDIQPYQSMVDGTWITSRPQHAAHLRQHGMIEVGNETKYLQRRPPPEPNWKETLIRVTKQKLGRM